MSWRKAKWADPGVHSDDFIGGSRVRLSFPDGSVIIGKLSVEPMSAYRQNGEVVMARIVTPYSGDTWINVHLADVELWETVAHEPTGSEPDPLRAAGEGI